MKGGATDVVSCFRAHSGTVFSLGSTYVVFEAEIARQGMLVLIWMGVVLVGGVAGAVRHTRTQAWGLIWEHALLPFFFFFRSHRSGSAIEIVHSSRGSAFFSRWFGFLKAAVVAASPLHVERRGSARPPV